MTQDDWPKGLTSVIAGQVQQVRGKRRMSAQQLADATAALGHPVPRSVIANLESGRRDTVSVVELLVLARALRVPPLVLLFPLGQEPAVEVLPGVTLPTWLAAQWFTGETPFPREAADGGWSSDIEDMEPWKEAAPAYFRKLDELLNQWTRAHNEARSNRHLARAATDEQTAALLREKADLNEEMLPGIEDRLRLYREQMRRAGLDPGELPSDLAHIDGGDHGQR